MHFHLAGNRLMSSSLNTATQLGSMPTMGISFSMSSRITSRISVSSFFALSSIPKSYNGRPQQSIFRGRVTSNPAASNTSFAAISVSGRKKLLNVSAHRITLGFWVVDPLCSLNQRRNVLPANFGISPLPGYAGHPFEYGSCNRIMCQEICHT